MPNLDGETNDPNLAGVFGKNTGQGGVGVAGVSNSGDGVRAVSTSGNGLSAFSDSSTAVFAQAKTQPGVSGISVSNDGVRAVSTSGNGLSAFSSTGTGLFAKGPVNAGFFEGNVAVTGDITLTGGQDCAERFDVLDAKQCDPGSVMSIDNSGALVPCHSKYDRRVVGVISGAGNLRPGIILDGETATEGRFPIALLGTVFSKAVADDSPIAVGDLLTTSSVQGHAMKAAEPSLAVGAVIGKALEPLPSGTGLIRILVALQ